MAIKKLSEEQAKLLAENIMPGFIPKDKTENRFSFHFTTEGTTYNAAFIRHDKGWALEKLYEVEGTSK